MTEKKIKWLFYTVLVGLIPILCRLLVWSVTNMGIIANVLSPSDIVAFGLVLHISNINEIEHVSEMDKIWKTVQNGSSIAFIFFYGVIYTTTLIGDKIFNTIYITYVSLFMAFASLMISYSVCDRLSKSEINITE